MYGFDVLSDVSRDRYVQRVDADLDKAQALAPDAYALGTVLVSTPISPWTVPDTAIAYSSGNRRTTQLGEQGLAELTNRMWEALRELGQVGTVDLGTGPAFGADVNTTMFLVRRSGQA